MIKIIITCLLSLSMMACSMFAKKTTPPLPPMPKPHHASLVEISELQQGERFFKDGYYKRAMNKLLPIACDGNAEAQYAVGYMYYYGLGVAQDTDVGYFWIERSASQHFFPAVEAVNMMAAGIHNDDKVLNAKGLRMIQ